MSGFPGIHLSFRFAWHWLTDGLILFWGSQKSEVASFFRPAHFTGGKVLFGLILPSVCALCTQNSEMSLEKMSPEKVLRGCFSISFEDSLVLW